MESVKLFMLLLGASPKERRVEQHDIFFGIASELRDLVPAILNFWPEAGKKVHIDGWREVTRSDGYEISVVPREELTTDNTEAKLFFLNLGGYKVNEFEEYHYKMIVACADKGQAVQKAYKTAFYKHTGFKGATSHIDDKYGVDVDDVYEITDILDPAMKNKYALKIVPAKDDKEDPIALGYFKLDKL